MNRRGQFLELAPDVWVRTDLIDAVSVYRLGGSLVQHRGGHQVSPRTVDELLSVLADDDPAEDEVAHEVMPFEFFHPGLRTGLKDLANRWPHATVAEAAHSLHLMMRDIDDHDTRSTQAS